MLKTAASVIKAFMLLLALSLNCVILDSTAYGQNNSVSGGLGLSDATWKELFGSPAPFERDAWSYQGGRYYTRSWARKGAPAGRNFTGYSPDDNYVKHIEIVWGRNKAVAPNKAWLAVRERLPSDSIVITKYRRFGSKAVEYYSSPFLAGRLYPAMAGDNFCVTPWGYGVGKFKVEYYFARGRVMRAMIDVGEPYETSLDICRGN